MLGGKIRVKTPRWISTSALPGEDSNHCDVDYLVRNVQGCVFFKEAIDQLPEDALVIEIGPHGLLQPLLRRALGKAKILSLMNRMEKDGFGFFMNIMGK